MLNVVNDFGENIQLFVRISTICTRVLIIIKEMSIFAVGLNMNLHEECLLRYLLNPMDLFRSTELLKINNSLIEKGYFQKQIIVKNTKINCTGV